jgi:Flp pilus assembly protein TadD
VRRGASIAARELELGRIKTATLGSAEVKIRLGRAALERGDLEGALARFDAAIGVEPGNALARRGRAYVLHRMGQYSDALEEWTLALELDPADADTRGNRALAAVEAGDLEVARADLMELTRTEGAAAPMVRVLKQAVEEASRRARSKDGEDEGGQ